MGNDVAILPPLPEVGRAESYYAKLLHQADRDCDVHGHEAAKVGQYISLALDPVLSWKDKERYFEHAMRRHCVPPPLPDETVWFFYRSLADMVRQYAGREAFRIASKEDDLYALHLQIGQTPEKIADDAEVFFQMLLGIDDHRPEWFNEEDWQQIKLIRDQWV